MKTAQTMKNAKISAIRNHSISEWFDEMGKCFAHSFEDGSSLVITKHGPIACSTKALQRWCKNSRIDSLL